MFCRSRRQHPRRSPQTGPETGRFGQNPQSCQKFWGPAFVWASRGNFYSGLGCAPQKSERDESNLWSDERADRRETCAALRRLCGRGAAKVASVRKIATLEKVGACWRAVSALVRRPGTPRGAKPRAQRAQHVQQQRAPAASRFWWRNRATTPRALLRRGPCRERKGAPGQQENFQLTLKKLQFLYFIGTLTFLAP
jgi:hypothetical protein